jgi:hypothetical protein
MKQIEKTMPYDQYKHSRYEYWMDEDTFREAYECYKELNDHNDEAMNRFFAMVCREAERLCDLTRMSPNGFRNTSPKDVLYTLRLLLMGSEWV